MVRLCDCGSAVGKVTVGLAESNGSIYRRVYDCYLRDDRLNKDQLRSHLSYGIAIASTSFYS